MEARPALAPVLAALSLLVASGRLPAAAQTRGQVRVPATAGGVLSSPFGALGGAPALSAAPSPLSLTPGLGLNAALPAAAVPLAALARSAPAALLAAGRQSVQVFDLP